MRRSSAEPRGGGSFGVHQLAAHHGGHQAARVELAAGVFADEPAVAQHRHAIADLVHLVEEVRDEQDGDALVAQPADQREQRLHFVGVEARGGLVEDQHARVGGDGARHGRELLQGGGQAAGELRHVEVDAEAGEQLARALIRSRASRCRRRGVHGRRG